MAPAALSAGVETPTSTDGKGLIPTHDASGASTKVVGVVGTGLDGAASSSVDALNGTTEEDHLTKAFRTITKVLIGDVAVGTNVTINVGSPVLAQITVGSGGNQGKSGGAGPGADEEELLLPETDYVFHAANIGAVTASDLDSSLFWYEEAEGGV